MQIASILNVHNNPELVRDTIDAQRVWVTDRILLIVDAKGWEMFQDFTHPDTVIKRGVHHGAPRSPYKNVGIGLLEAYRLWPDSDWFCYSEFDTLFISDSFKEDLERASKSTAIFLGHYPKLKHGGEDHWLVRELMEKEYGEPACWKSIGCLMFYSKFCMQQFVETNFITRMLDRTSSYQGSHLPDFYDYAVEEIIFPSAASLFGDVKALAGYGAPPDRYLIKYGYDLHQAEVRDEASVLHPIKDYNHPIRLHFREARKPFLE